MDYDEVSNFRPGFTLGITPGFVLPNGHTELVLVADYRGHNYGIDRVDGRFVVNTVFIGPAVTGLFPSRRGRSYTGFELAAGFIYYGKRHQKKPLVK